MTFYHSKDAVFQINDGVGLRDVSPYIVSVDGLPGAADLLDVTALGGSGRGFIKGLENITFTIEFLWSDAATVGPHTVLALVRALTAKTAFDYGPEGKVNPDIKYSGDCWLRSWTVLSRMGELVTGRAEFQVDGVVAVGAYA